MELDDLLDNLAAMSGALQAAFTRQSDCTDILKQTENLFGTVGFNVGHLREKLDRVEVAKARLAELTEVVYQSTSVKAAR